MHVNTTHSPSLTLNTKIMNKVLVCVHQENLSGFILRSWLGIRFGKFYGFGKIITVVLSGLGTFVEESGQERYWAHIVARGFTAVLQVGLGVPHVGPEVGVGREHGLVLVGLGALQGKVVGKGGPPGVQAVKVEVGQGMLIAVIAPPQDDGQGLLLDHLYLPALVLGQARVKHWCSKLKG